MSGSQLVGRIATNPSYSNRSLSCGSQLVRRIANPSYGMRFLSWLLAAAGSILFLIQPVRADTESGEKVYQRTLRGTVWILAPRGERTGAGGGSLASGSGSLLDKTRRLVITNYHIVGEAERVSVFFPAFQSGKLVAERKHYWDLLKNGKAIPGRVIARDSKRDLALIELTSVPDQAQVLFLAREGGSPGQRVHSIGNPGQSGALWAYTSGTVRTAAYTKQWRVREGTKIINLEARVIETQSPTNQGDSGGPLVNDRGELVAVTQGYAPGAQLMSLFVDVGDVKAFLAKEKLLAKLPQPPRPRLAANPGNRESEKAAEKRPDSTALERRAATKLHFAKTLAGDGKLDRAKYGYEEIIADFPNTKAAAEAKLLLDKLEK